MSDRVLFFSDVHLSSHRPEKTRLLHRFLEEEARRSTKLVCLGDLFDFWLGWRHARTPEFRETLDRLAALVRSGVEVEFVKGNRDFQVGREFERDRSIPVHEDSVTLELLGRRVLACHGDLFCTADRRYQIYRRLIRSAPLLALAELVPFPISHRLARGMRTASQREVAVKSLDQMSISRSAIGRIVDRGLDVVICGHVHQASRFEVQGSRRTGECFTLGDWEGRGRYLSFENGRFEHQEMQ